MTEGEGQTYVLNESALVLEGVTLAQVVELVVEVLVDLARGTVADEQTTENTHAAHPEESAVERKYPSAHQVPSQKNTSFSYIGSSIENRATVERTCGKAKRAFCIPGHTSLLGTLTLTQATVTADSAGRVELTGTRARVHGHGLADDEAIADELADGLAGVGVGDLVHLIGVEPNLALAAAHHGGGEALLGAKVDPVEQGTLKVSMRSKVSGVEFLGFDKKNRP